MQDQRAHKACVSRCPDHITHQHWTHTRAIGHLLKGTGLYVVTGGLFGAAGSVEQLSVSHTRPWLPTGKDRSAGLLRT